MPVKGTDPDRPQPLRSKPDYSPKVGIEGPLGGVPEQGSAAAGTRVSLLPIVLTVPRRGPSPLPGGHRSHGSLCCGAPSGPAEWLPQRPVAAVTRCCRFRGLKRHSLIILQLRR